MQKTAVSVARAAVTKKPQTNKKETSNLISKKLSKLVSDFSEDLDALVQLKVSLYKKAITVEEVFNEDWERNPEVRDKYKTFKSFMADTVPNFDYLDYLKHLIFLKHDVEDRLSKCSNSAFDKLYNVLVISKATGKMHVKTKEVLSSLPTGKIITFEDAQTVLSTLQVKNTHGRKMKKEGNPPRLRVGGSYTKAELKNLTKNDLIALCVNLQKALKRAKSK